MSSLEDALLCFAQDGILPDEDDSTVAFAASALPAALSGLTSAKVDLESEIRSISKEVAPDVDAWISHAKSLQMDIDKSRRLAGDIVRQAEAEAQRMEALKDAETYVQFLEREQAFNLQLGETLHLITQTTETLAEAELSVAKGEPTIALRSVADAVSILEQIPAHSNVKLVRVLENRISDAREMVQKQYRNDWARQVEIDPQLGQILVHGSPENLSETIKGLDQFHEINDAVRQLWEKLNVAILQPRLTNDRSPPSIQVIENRLALTSGPTDSKLGSLFQDLELIVHFLHKRLPSEFFKPLAEVMMPALSSQLTSTWLDDAIPDSLDSLTAYQEAINQVSDFADVIDKSTWPGAGHFRDWVAGAPKNWLMKRRETCLNRGRNDLALGIRTPQRVEHKVPQPVSREDHLDTGGNLDSAVDDWDSGWNSGDGDNPGPEVFEGKQTKVPEASNESDGADAWGWGDDEVPDTNYPDAGPSPSKTQRMQASASSRAETASRPLILTEDYWISSMPGTIFQILEDLYNDIANLSHPNNESNPVSPAAGGLGNVASLIVALYRAVSPSYYESDLIGFMYAYNDAMWLCDTLKDFSESWQNRSESTTRLSQGLKKLEPEVKALKVFGRRSYSKEMDTQRLLLKDILGGSQNFLQQDGMESSIDAVIGHIQQVSEQWRKILSLSVWRSAVGSLVNTVSDKMINDVFDLSDMSIDEAELTAKLISKITSLDSLFTSTSAVSGGDEQAAPLMAEYADHWLRLQFLSEVLQSNLNDIKWLWFESELSFHFTQEEVVDLIHLSFENNANVRAALKEIKERPMPQRGRVR